MLIPSLLLSPLFDLLQEFLISHLLSFELILPIVYARVESAVIINILACVKYSHIHVCSHCFNTEDLEFLRGFCNWRSWVPKQLGDQASCPEYAEEFLSGNRS